MIEWPELTFPPINLYNAPRINSKRRVEVTYDEIVADIKKIGEAITVAATKWEENVLANLELLVKGELKQMYTQPDLRCAYDQFNAVESGVAYLSGDRAGLIELVVWYDGETMSLTDAIEEDKRNPEFADHAYPVFLPTKKLLAMRAESGTA